MGEELRMAYNDNTGKWEVAKEPYAVIEVATKEDYDEIQKAIDFWDNHKAKLATLPENQE